MAAVAAAPVAAAAAPSKKAEKPEVMNRDLKISITLLFFPDFSVECFESRDH